MMGRRARRTFAIERKDGEPITRADIQFDLLSHIFADETQAFSDPNGGSKLSFRDLYVNAILNSPKAKSVLKEKLALPAFATDFAMLALLTNIGRIAATMSFFAEMRTAQRTYHPIPSLQRTNGNLLDAPRIKAILKTSVLEGETKNGLATPAQVLARVKAGQIPATTLPNLIFVFANHSVQIGRDHLVTDMEFVDLFLPNPASSASRARVFLWLCYHYLEGPFVDPEDDYDGDVAGVNPFSDPSNPGKVPPLVMLTADEIVVENLDPEEEKALANRLITQREAIVQDHIAKESAKELKAKAESAAGETPSPAKPKGKRANAKAGPSIPLKRKAQAIKEEEEEEEAEELPLKRLELDDSDDVPDVSTPLRAIYRQERRSPLRSPPPPRSFFVAQPDPYSHRYSRYKHSRPRSMLQHAWHVIATSDPLADSDEEEDDEDVQMDHAERLAVISRVRGKAPTPEPEGVRPIPLHLAHWHDDIFV
ncbi:hypothetical protein C8F04DRAFT_1076176 [Mycena alexandri]|uniref:Ino eighty subunit 1 n=1 Tax=Mycena alexandri TaxID=1745969 RepID=A0AAD6TAF8_9AGAR|nr:hypothetical protein C8F04DRAFT_1076176 [Mycena alexandri]